MKKLPILVALLAFSCWCLAADSADEPVTKTLVWPDGTRYVGGVVDGKRTGKGTIFWQDGTRFVGQFENDMRNGPGTMILPDGTVYTGFFRDDELIDTESTIAASTAGRSVELEDVAALDETTLPIEADSVGDPMGDTAERAAEAEAERVRKVEEERLAQEAEAERIRQAEEQQLAQQAEAEQLRKAEEDRLAQAGEAERLRKAEEERLAQAAEAERIRQAEEERLAQQAEIELAQDYSGSDDVTEVTESVKDELIATIDLWKAAWSVQNANQYLATYSDDFAIPSRGQSRRTWEALRRTRITRPRYINIDVSYQRFELVETNVVDVFFRQTYRSNTYSDLTDKVLRMGKDGTDWKILIERSR